MSVVVAAGDMDNMVDEIEVSPQVFSDLSKLEKEFADAELEALRRKEHNLTPLYKKRTQILQKVPSFWPTVLLNGPQEFQSILDLESPNSIDLVTISAIKSIQVERYGITSETEGEPRNLRFTFEFGKNDIFEDETITKEFEFVRKVHNHNHNTDDDDGEDEEVEEDTGALISKPVAFNWTKKGKKLVAKCGGLLDLACELYQAEEAIKLNIPSSSTTTNSKDGKKAEVEISMADREGLWQYEKLRAKLEKIESGEEEVVGCWLDWFGYRGPVDDGCCKTSSSKTKTKTKTEIKTKPVKSNGTEPKNGNGIKSPDEDEDAFDGFHSDLDDDDDEDDEETGLLEVEIFPAGEEIAISLAEDLWPNVMDYFMAAQEPDDDDEEFDEDEFDDEDEEVPELVDAGSNGDGVDVDVDIGVDAGIDGNLKQEEEQQGDKESDNDRPSKKLRTK